VAVRAAPLILSALASEKSLKYSAVDTLTQLPNERSFYEYIERWMGSSDSLLLIVAKIGNLSEFNKICGPAATEELLRSLSSGLRSGTRDVDKLTRATADEFFILMPRASAGEVRQVIDRLRKAVSKCLQQTTATELLTPNVIFGWAELGHDGDPPQQLIAMARARSAPPRGKDASKVISLRKFSK